MASAARERLATRARDNIKMARLCDLSLSCAAPATSFPYVRALGDGDDFQLVILNSIQF